MGVTMVFCAVIRGHSAAVGSLPGSGMVYDGRYAVLFIVYKSDSSPQRMQPHQYAGPFPTPFSVCLGPREMSSHCR